VAKWADPDLVGWRYDDDKKVLFNTTPPGNLKCNITPVFKIWDGFSKSHSFSLTMHKNILL
jgi:hypothetical protein